jgi:lysozyme family protein
MTNFDKAIEKVLAHEGGYVNDPVDRGGETNWGISYRFLEKQVFGYGNVPPNYVRNLTRDQAKELYRKYFWDKVSGDAIKAYAVSFPIFDMAVNKGPHVVVNHVREVFGQAMIPMTEAGAYMPTETLRRLNNLNTEYEQSEFIKRFVAVQKEHYNEIVANNPSQKRFITGWYNRLASLESYARNQILAWTVGGVRVTKGQQKIGIGVGVAALAVSGAFLFNRIMVTKTA